MIIDRIRTKRDDAQMWNMRDNFSYLTHKYDRRVLNETFSQLRQQSCLDDLFEHVIPNIRFSSSHGIEEDFARILTIKTCYASSLKRDRETLHLQWIARALAVNDLYYVYLLLATEHLWPDMNYSQLVTYCHEIVKDKNKLLKLSDTQRALFRRLALDGKTCDFMIPLFTLLNNIESSSTIYKEICQDVLWLITNSPADGSGDYISPNQYYDFYYEQHPMFENAIQRALKDREEFPSTLQLILKPHMVSDTIVIVFSYIKFFVPPCVKDLGTF
jgi:hypothetical protein